MSFEQYERRNRRDTSSRLPCAMLVMCVGDGEVHVVCVWRYINEWWSRTLDENQLTGPIPSELGQLTNLQELYVLFTPPSFHVAHSRALSFLSPAHCALSTFYSFSPPGSSFR